MRQINNISDYAKNSIGKLASNFRIAMSIIFLFAGITTSMATVEIPSDDPLDLSEATITGSGELKESGGMNTFDNMRANDYATFAINNTASQRYDVTFKAATARGDVSLRFEFLDAEENVVSTNTLPMTSGSWTKFLDYDFTTATLPEGALTLKITFLGSKYTVNVGDIYIKASTSTETYYTLTTGVTPEGSGCSISYDPHSLEYVAGTEVTFTANEFGRYLFKNWTDGEGNELGTETTLKVTMNSNMTVIANFYLSEGIIEIPTTSENPFQNSWADCFQGYFYGTETLNYNAGWLTDHWDCMGNGSRVTYKIRNTKETIYTISCTAATKKNDILLDFYIMSADSADMIWGQEDIAVENCGSWDVTKGSRIEVNGVELEEGDYLFVVEFHNYWETPTAEQLAENPEWVAYTANVGDFAFSEMDGEKSNVINIPADEALDLNKATITGAGGISTSSEFPTFDSMKDGTIAVFELNSEAAQEYMVSYMAATKNECTLTFTFTNENGEVVAEEAAALSSTGNWQKYNKHKFYPILPAGNITLTITFNGPKYTVNVGDIHIIRAVDAPTEVALTINDVTVEQGEAINFSYTSTSELAGTMTYVVKDEDGNVMEDLTSLEPGTYTVTGTYTPADGENVDVTVAGGVLTVNEGDPTGIDTVKSNTANDGKMYDLSGRRISTKAGIYIQNGKKYIAK